MARFVYLGPPGEQVSGTVHAMTGAWMTGEPRDIDDGAAIAWLRRHPHWQELSEAEAPESEPASFPVRRGPGRPRKVVI